jgi:hypothetical protein
MKPIVIQNVNSLSASAGYINTIKSALLLGKETVSIGVDAHVYYNYELAKNFKTELQLQMLIERGLEGIQKKDLEESLRIVKDYKKSKNKNAKQIVAYKQMVQSINNIYLTQAEIDQKSLDKIFGLEELRKLVEINKITLYNLLYDHKNFEKEEFTFLNILSLKIPEPEKGNPIFFLNLELTKEIDLEIEILSPSDTKATNLNTIYGEKSLVFPYLNLLTDKDILAIESQLKYITTTFINHLENWVNHCYESPNTTKSLEFFKENLNKEYLQSIENEPMKNLLLKNIAAHFNNNLFIELILIEIPITSFWELLFKMNMINHTEKDILYNIKQKNPQQYERRIPVVLVKPTIPVYSEKNNPILENQVQSVRKTLPLD